MARLNTLKKLAEFVPTDEEISCEISTIKKEIHNGVQGQKSSLAMIPSYIEKPSGKEQGSFLALDFGGTNLRVAKVMLTSGEIDIVVEKSVNIKNFISATNIEAEEFFLLLAEFIADFAGKQGYFLGHTFSYPVLQKDANSAYLSKWTKEMDFVCAPKKDVNTLLAEKLIAVGREDIKPIVILNDTVAVYLAGSYLENGENILGSICGTGHNTCYFEPKQNMVINLEIGNFSPKCRNDIDIMLDKKSSVPESQHLEKMVSGEYMPKLFNALVETYDLPCSFVKNMIELVEKLEDHDPYVQKAAEVVIMRSAKLLAAEYTAIYEYLFEKEIIIKKIVVDGSLYNRVDYFANLLKGFLKENIVKTPVVIGGQGFSLQGAGVATAILVNSTRLNI